MVNQFFMKIGESIYPSNPEIGLFIFIIFLGIVFFLLWKHDFLGILKSWREKDEKKREIRYKQEEKSI